MFGFGRIGRNIFRQAYKNPLFNIVAISEYSHIETLHYLLARDSVHGVLEDEIGFEKDSFVINGKKVKILPGEKPGGLNWDKFDIDFVIDATGKYLRRSDLEKHISSGAKRVIVSSMPEDHIDRVVINGINDDEIQTSDKIISATSSTTQVLALMVKILDEKYALNRAMMTTVHAFTADQPLSDAVRLDLRRSRSAVENIIPNTTHAPAAVERLMPKFSGKLDGMAFNVPVPNGSCVDLTTDLKTLPNIDQVNELMLEKSKNGLHGIVGYTEDPIVSSDVRGRQETLVFDAKATMITAGSLLKTICWYDNGWGFSKRILDTIELYNRKD